MQMSPPSMMQVYQAVTSANSASFLAGVRDKTAQLVDMGLRSGHLDVHDFQAALFNAFGRESHGVVQADDTINYAKLDDLMGGIVEKKRLELVPDNLFNHTTHHQSKQLLDYLSANQQQLFAGLFEINV